MIRKLKLGPLAAHRAKYTGREFDDVQATLFVRVVFSNKKRPARFAGKIEFKNVHFAYPTDLRRPILNGISFVVQPGEKVALVGGTRIAPHGTSV